ncbi:MAG: hydantoinase B/oxoprolinase family protein [Balneolaceae bacterium]|nr:hydantoinase B/oxoprolinase family protein [Balneolaceae bacterium]
MSSLSKKWNICIDTGGTFTDCIATSPDGTILRRKVLSSSALRGSARSTNNPRKVSIRFEYETPDDFFKGYDFSLLNDADRSCRIISSDENESILTLSDELPVPSGQNVPFEIRSPEEAPVLAARLVTQTPIGSPLPPLQFRLSTTKGTNALLERRGGRTLFLITEGFKDLLKIKNQQRPDLFSLNIQKPEPFYHKIIEVPERLDADGNRLKKPDLTALRNQIEPLLDDVDAAAICLMHSYLNPDHEILIEEMLLNLGMPFVSRSSKLSPAIKIVPRAVTTDIDAFLTPVMQQYLDRISEVIGSSSLRIMSSAGSLVKAERYTPKDGLFSGPAGGVIGAAAVANRAASRDLSGFGNLTGLSENLQKIISFDMGGTSTDVARYAGEIDYIFEHTVGDATLSAPAIEIETVAAGGGSICSYDGKSLTAGPESAGADPGPACYGRGGPLTITDVNLLSGRLHPSNFHITINMEAARNALNELMKIINQNRNQPLQKEDVLEGFLDIANERMAQAIRKISIQKGFDPSEYALVAFGGAGAQHALAVAAKLNISTVLVPSDAGLLSAYGLQQAKTEQIASRQILKTFREVREKLGVWFDELSGEATSDLKKQGIKNGQIEISRKQLYLRLKGQDSSLEIDWNGVEKVAAQFQQVYEDHYGHWIEEREIEVEAIRVIASEKKDVEIEIVPVNGDVLIECSPSGETEILHNKTSHTSPFYHRKSLKTGAEIAGPALILDPHSTTVIEPGWEGQLLDDGTWILSSLQGFSSKNPDKSANSGHSERNLQGFSTENQVNTKSKDLSKGNLGGFGKTDRPEAIQLQLYTNRFRSVADQMGEMLRKTALSVNIKERLDYSCALLDADGYLVVNAPHIPVHLGAMGTCVRTLIRYFESSSSNPPRVENPWRVFREGDVLITNHPGYGGSHLPDVTVVTPVFVAGKRIGFVASRAHHAEIGGKRPGSMPPDATNLAEEGVVIPPAFLSREGKFRWEQIEGLLRSAEWPSRSIEENMADIRAAVAANHRGVSELKKLADTFGADEVKTYMQRLKLYAAERMKLTLENIPDGTFHAEEQMDDGSLLRVNCSVKGSSMSIDFSGSSGVHPGNLNANPSIVNSVIMYVLRLMVNEPLPLNDGLLEPVEITIPDGMLNPPFPDNPAECPAVVGGNIETSQRLVDTLLKAFGLAACSYGTMNNVLFGNDTFGYYETVGGGTGAGDGFHGADAVHQHMTNTRAADPEILEHRFPVRLDRYSIRESSGGNGTWRGGNGIIREITFLEPVSLSVLTQHRVVKPYGLKGGEPGATGKQEIRRKKGTTQKMKWRDGAELNPGDRFLLFTPGGGGFGC